MANMLAKVTSITENTITSVTTTTYDDGSWINHYVAPDGGGYESWEKYDAKGNRTHFKNTNAFEYWTEFDVSKNITHHKVEGGQEYFIKYFQFKDGKLVDGWEGEGGQRFSFYYDPKEAWFLELVQHTQRGEIVACSHVK